MKQDTVFARTLRGIEWIGAAEIQASGFDVEPVRSDRSLFVPVEPDALPQVALWRTVDDAFLILRRQRDFGRDRQSFREAMAAWPRVDWGKAMSQAVQSLGRGTPDRRFSVSASFNGKRNFSRFELEDALGAAVAASSPFLYSPHRDSSETLPLGLRIHLDGASCVVGLRVAEGPLHRRGWKVRTLPGTLHPPLAAAMGYFVAGERPLSILDPFCGCGTILIELAGRAGGLHHLQGIDSNPEAVACARENAAAANVALNLSNADAVRLPVREGSVDVIVSNPPWGKQVQANRPSELMQGFLRQADRILSGRGCLVLLHEWGSALSEDLRFRKFELLHEQNLRVAGTVATLTFAMKQGDDLVAPALEYKKLLSAKKYLQDEQSVLSEKWVKG